jgi:hypothetical protein
MTESTQTELRTEPDRTRAAVRAERQEQLAIQSRLIQDEDKRTRAAIVKALLPIHRNVEAHAITAKSLGQDDRAWLDLLILIERAENWSD